MIPFTIRLDWSGITYVISHNYAKFKVDSCNSLTLEKAIKLHNVIIKSNWNKDENDYYYNILSEKTSYESPKNKILHNDCIVIELTFLKELMLLKEVHLKSVVWWLATCARKPKVPGSSPAHAVLLIVNVR